MAKHRNRGKNARNISRKIWLSSAEDERIVLAAGDVPVSAWLRDVALREPSKPRTPNPKRKIAERTPSYAPLIRPLATAVSRSGNNLNQIARATNICLKEGRTLDAVGLALEIARCRQELRDGLRQVLADFLKEARKRAGKNLQTR